MPSEDGQLTETCRGNKINIHVESHWTALTIILSSEFVLEQMMLISDDSGVLVRT
jgi:hypothetical protein